MRIKQIFSLYLLLFLPLATYGEDELPSVSSLATYVDKDGQQQETTSISDGEAPLEVTFTATPQNLGSHTPAYEWHFRKQGQTGELFVRYEETTTYRFVDSGTFDIVLRMLSSETGELLDSATVTVAISESKLEFPNAFSPNDDDKNKIYKAKKGYRSIVEFHAYIFNRWGQKLFEWTDPAEGWDGTYKGNDVKEGVYYVLVKAKGADGRNYNIKKAVNLLRGYTEETSNSTL